MVVHGSYKAIVRSVCRGEYHQRRAGRGIPQNNLFAPVAEEVGLQTGCLFGAVARRRAGVVIECEDTVGFAGFPVPFVDAVAVEKLVLQGRRPSKRGS